MGQAPVASAPFFNPVRIPVRNRSLPAAFLVLLATSAATGVVATDLGDADRLRLDHDPLGKAPLLVCAFELAAFVVTVYACLIAKASDKLDFPLIILWAAIGGADNLKASPF